MTPQWAARASVDESTKGAIIIAIQEGRAAALGLRPGDIITEVNGQAITSAPDLAEQLPSEGNLSLTIRRGNREGTISTFME
jgi:serine protease Do